MKIRGKNPILKGTIEELVRHAYDKKAPFWRSIADLLNRPTRNHSAVNICHIDKHTKKGDIIIVPGAVLGTGELAKPVTIAALKFSASAIEKISKSGGRAINIRELLEEKPDGKGIKIIG